MTRIRTTLGAACALAMLLGAAAPASARHHHYYGQRYRSDYRRDYSYRDDCSAAHHRAANTGTVVGAIGGGLIGNQLAGGGSRTLGTVLGAGGGAVIGHQIGAHSHRC